MASPSFRIGTASALVGPYTYGSYDTSITGTQNYYCKIELQSTSGVNSIGVSIPSADPVTLAAGVPVVTVDQATKTATFQLPDAKGRSLNVLVTINNGLTNGVADSTLSKSLQVNVLTEAGVAVGCVGEATEYHATYGYTQKINALANASGSTATVVYENEVSLAGGAGASTIITIPQPSADCVVRFKASIVGTDDAAVACYERVGAADYGIIGAGWTLDPAGMTAVYSYETDAAWDCGWAVAGSTITFTVTPDAANTTNFKARVDALYIYH